MEFFFTDREPVRANLRVVLRHDDGDPRATALSPSADELQWGSLPG